MLFCFKGLEDKEQNLARRLSASDILSEKVRYYFVELDSSVRLTVVLLYSVLSKGKLPCFPLIYFHHCDIFIWT